MFKILSLLLLTLIALLAVGFAIMNSTTVTVQYYLGSQDVPLALLLLGVLFLGIFLGYFVALMKIFSLKLEIRRLRNLHH